MLEYLERRFARILLAIPNIYVFRVNEAELLFSVKNMERQISLALEQDRIAVFYQPIYSVREQRFTSAEALVRMIDEDGKIIMPGEFIRIAEENGMIRGLDLSIVAEGVETKEQLLIMEELGIQYIQGYYFSKPLSEQHYIEFIKEKNLNQTGGVV